VQVGGALWRCDRHSLLLREAGQRRKLITRRYTTGEVDAFAAYSLELDKCFLLPAELWANRRNVQLRLAPTLNNQRQGINWAEHYEFGARLRALGAVAQLGERLAGSQKVTGSIPVGSIFVDELAQEVLFS
jgi:hypothetical protein